MIIETLALGLYQTNCYILKIDDKAIVIDPGKKFEKVIDRLEGYKLIAILLTHGHFDHIGAVDDLVNKYNCPVYISFKDKELLNNKLNRNANYEGKLTSKITDLKEGKLVIDKFEFEIMETPGHTEGSLLILNDGNMFSGDTLFYGTIGRTDLMTSSTSEMRKSLKRIKQLDKDFKVYPGHGESSSLSYELKFNPYLNTLRI